jgi:tRNA(Ile)-lysidine synthase TilS/MesJ
MGRRKRDGNYSPPKYEVVQDLEQNEENGYSDPDSNKTKINYTRNPMKHTRAPLKNKYYK